MQALGNAHSMCLLSTPSNTILPNSNLLAFTEEDNDGVVYPNWDFLVISAKIMGVMVHHIMVDNRAFYNIILVHRIMVDNVAFYNIIFNKTMEQLGHFTDYIESCELSIRGFENATI